MAERVASAILGKINALIGGHNTNAQAHQDIREDIPGASSTTPSADTTSGSVGTGTAWARSDHTHPKSSLYAEVSHTHPQYLTSHQDISGKEDTSNKLTSLQSLDDYSTDTQYASAKLIHEYLETKEDTSNKVTSIDGFSTDDEYPSAKCVCDKIEERIDDVFGYIPQDLGGMAYEDNVDGYVGAVALSNDYNDLDNKPTIPTATSDLTNDGDGINPFLTEHQSLANYVQKSQTNGLLKNDGTVDTTIYAESPHVHGIEDTDLFDVLDCINNNFDNLGSGIVFFDDCSSDMSSQYDVKGYIQEGTYPIDITYYDGDEEPCYVLYARPNGRESFSWFAIPNLRGLDNIRITATCVVYDYSLYSQIFLGLCDTLEQTDSSNYKFDFVSIRGDEKFDAVKNNIEQFSNNVKDVNYEIVKLVFERIGNNITGKVYNEDGTALLSWNSYTTTNEYDNPYYFLGLMSKYSYYYGLYELKAEQLII